MHILYVDVAPNYAHQMSTPVLRAVIDMQDFNAIGFHGIDYDVGKRRQRQFSCSVPMAGPALVW